MRRALLRELTAAAETGPDQDWANHLIEVLLAAKGWADAARAARAAGAAGAERIDPDLLAALAARYDGHLSQGRAANPPGRRRTKTHALIDRLNQRREQVLRFTVDLAVPFDNNQAERDLRMVKLQQKTSGGWRTLAGAEAFCARAQPHRHRTQTPRPRPRRPARRHDRQPLAAHHPHPSPHRLSSPQVNHLNSYDESRDDIAGDGGTGMTYWSGPVAFGLGSGRPQEQ